MTDPTTNTDSADTGEETTKGSAEVTVEGEAVHDPQVISLVNTSRAEDLRGADQ